MKILRFGDTMSFIPYKSLISEKAVREILDNPEIKQTVKNTIIGVYYGCLAKILDVKKLVFINEIIKNQDIGKVVSSHLINILEIL